MAKRWLFRLAAAALLLIAAGTGERAPGMVTAAGIREKPAYFTDVYPDGGELADIPMGTFDDGEQKTLCSVKMPRGCLFRAGYTPDGLTNVMIEETAGGGTLESALERGLTEQPYAICRARLQASDNTDIEFAVISAANWTMENLKGYAPDAAELGNSRNPAVYYTDAAALHLYYCLSPEYALLVHYWGKPLEQTEWEQLAENLYGLIEAVSEN